MAEEGDIRPILDGWEYDPDANVRTVRAPDGREVIQVRLPLGVEQYEVDGRPDGRRPHGAESVLAYHRGRLAKAVKKDAAKGFKLAPEECAELFDEGVMYYYRYLHLFRLEDWGRTVRDTARNIELFDFVRRYAERKEDRQHLEQWRPYIFRINAAAQAMAELKRNRHDRALEVVRRAVAQIEALEDMGEATFGFERERSLRALREMIEQIEKVRPVTRIEQLERELGKAVRAEEYERAAALRDRIRSIREKHAAAT